MLVLVGDFEIRLERLLWSAQQTVTLVDISVSLGDVDIRLERLADRAATQIDMFVSV